MLALQGTTLGMQPAQLQTMLGAYSEDAIDLLLSQCPDIAKLQPSVLLSRLCMLKVGFTPDHLM